MVSQEDIELSIKKEPGITQAVLRQRMMGAHRTGGFGTQIRQLLRWNRIRREKYYRTYRLYPNGVHDD